MASSPAQPLRPSDCPACKHCAHQEGCGLLTFAASQLGAVCALIVGGVFYFLQILATETVTSKTVSGPTAPLSGPELVFRRQFWAILLITAIYYAVAEWLLEERDYHTLRKIKLSTLEFWMRVFLAVMFGVAAAGTPEPLRMGLSAIHSSFFVLALIYLVFLLWDVIVSEGGEVKLAWRVAILDAVGAVLTLACLWTHHVSPTFASLFIVPTIMLPGILLYQNSKELGLWTRLLDRNALR